jgi:hypothetical protein
MRLAIIILVLVSGCASPAPKPTQVSYGEGGLLGELRRIRAAQMAATTKTVTTQGANNDR